MLLQDASLIKYAEVIKSGHEKGTPEKRRWRGTHEKGAVPFKKKPQKQMFLRPERIYCLYCFKIRQP